MSDNTSNSDTIFVSYYGNDEIIITTKAKEAEMLDEYFTSDGIKILRHNEEYDRQEHKLAVRIISKFLVGS